MALVFVEIEKILGPSKLLAQPKPVKTKLHPKQPASLTRVAGVEANVELGRKLVALRTRQKSNKAFGRAVRCQFDVNAQHAVECACVARAFGDRPEIYRRLSWEGLLQLSSPTMPAPVRQAIEMRILAGERIVAPQIRRARGKLRSGRPRRPANQPTVQRAA